MLTMKNMTEEHKREERNRKQRERRAANGNKYTKSYEKTKSGFLMRLYRNMKSRITGVQKAKHHLYDGKELSVTKNEFKEWATGSHEFHALWDNWVSSGHDRKLTPSVDRIDSSGGYSIQNMEWVTHSENSRRGASSKVKNTHALDGRIV